MAARGHDIRPVKGGHKKVHVRIDCEKCGRFECLTFYENQIEESNFKLSFFECMQCRRTFCHICVRDEEVACPFCGKLKPKKVKPFDVYVCGVCFRQWWGKGGFCQECDYTEKKGRDHHYQGPPD